MASAEIAATVDGILRRLTAFVATGEVERFFADGFVLKHGSPAMAAPLKFTPSRWPMDGLAGRADHPVRGPHIDELAIDRLAFRQQPLALPALHNRYA